jgi:hypothetical protein
MGIFTAIKNLLTQFLHMQSGLIFLCSKTDTVNGILRTLTQQMVCLFLRFPHMIIWIILQGYQVEEGQGEQPTHQLGLKMIYYLQTLQIVDQLQDYLSRGSDSLSKFD